MANWSSENPRVYEEITDFSQMSRFDRKDIKIKISNKMNFSFLKSSRFWCLIVGALMVYLKTKGFVGEPEMLLANTILGGFVAIRTLDRSGDKVVEGAKINSGMSPEKAKEV